MQLEFADNYNKPADIIHNLMLDRTHTGHQTLGAETVVDLDLSVVTDIGQYPNVNCTRWLLYNVNACVSSYVHVHVYVIYNCRDQCFPCSSADLGDFPLCNFYVHVLYPLITLTLLVLLQVLLWL